MSFALLAAVGMAEASVKKFFIKSLLEKAKKERITEFSYFEKKMPERVQKLLLELLQEDQVEILSLILKMLDDPQALDINRCAEKYIIMNASHELLKKLCIKAISDDCKYLL